MCVSVSSEPVDICASWVLPAVVGQHQDDLQYMLMIYSFIIKIYSPDLILLTCTTMAM